MNRRKIRASPYHVLAVCKHMIRLCSYIFEKTERRNKHEYKRKNYEAK